MTAISREFSSLITIMMLFMIPSATASPPTGQVEPSTKAPSTHDASSEPIVETSRKQIIHANDRVLFVGDDMTQQMFYTRAVATAFMSLWPDGRMRFYNGGRDAATVSTAASDLPDLLELTQPTLVLVCLGLNDARTTTSHDSQSQIDRYRIGLMNLVEAIKAYPSVTQVVLVGPPAGQVGLNAPLDATGYNQRLEQLSIITAEIAKLHNTSYIDLYRHTKNIYQAANQIGGNPLTHAGWLPTEDTHVVIASLILRGLGVTGKHLERIGWSPLRPVDMRRIRQVLALDIPSPPLGVAHLSRDLYESLRSCDERFFRYWRLAHRRTDPISRSAQLASIEDAWTQTYRIAALYKKASTPNPSP